MKRLKVQKLHPNAILPTRGYDKSVGLDLYSVEDYEIRPGETVKVRTGIAIQPDVLSDNKFNYVGKIEDRSSLGSKSIHKLAGIIDVEEFLGEILVCLTNLNIYPVLENIMWNIDEDLSEFSVNPIEHSLKKHTFFIKKGDKVAQLLIGRVHMFKPEWADKLNNTERGKRGFGSTNN